MRLFTRHINTAVTLSVTPDPALIDDVLSIRLSGLNPHQNVTIHVRTADDRGVKVASYGCFKANQRGDVDVSNDQCLHGTYSGTCIANVAIECLK